MFLCFDRSFSLSICWHYHSSDNIKPCAVAKRKRNQDSEDESEEEEEEEEDDDFA